MLQICPKWSQFRNRKNPDDFVVLLLAQNRQCRPNFAGVQRCQSVLVQRRRCQSDLAEGWGGGLASAPLTPESTRLALPLFQYQVLQGKVSLFQYQVLQGKVHLFQYQVLQGKVLLIFHRGLYQTPVQEEEGEEEEEDHHEIAIQEELLRHSHHHLVDLVVQPAVQLAALSKTIN